MTHFVYGCLHVKFILKLGNIGTTAVISYAVSKQQPSSNSKHWTGIKTMAKVSGHIVV